MITIDEIVKEMGDALLRREGAYFVGAGISVPSGLPDWLDLIKQLATPLRIKITNEDFMPLIAQYCVNATLGNRGPLIGRLKRMLFATSPKSNPYHIAIRRTNVTTIWTTNYDTLLEDALATSRLGVRANDFDLTAGIPDCDIEVLKVHGCVNRSSPDEFVLTQEDYEEFESRRPVMSRRLRHDLMHHSMLFIGYGYRDPNITTALVEVRRLSHGTTREHFLITKRESDPVAGRRQELWLSDLGRVGIRSALINDYGELTDVLNCLALASRGKSIFVTGSHSVGPALATKLRDAAGCRKGRSPVRCPVRRHGTRSSERFRGGVRQTQTRCSETHSLLSEPVFFQPEVCE